MGHSISTYSLSGYQMQRGVCGITRIEHEHCPPFALVVLVFVAAMLGGAYLTSKFDSIAAGWIGGVAILVVLGALIDRWFTGTEALERRIRQRAKARRKTLRAMPLSRRCDWTGSTTREWTSTSAYRRHPQPMTMARAG